MYLEITKGKKFSIQGINCYIPPEGYVVNIKTGELEYRGIHKRSDIPEEQYWERTPLPAWYKQKMKEEDAYNKKKKEDDLPYFDKQLEEYTQKEWDRRLNGFWFYNNGEPVYITGSHYVFLQWWQIDIGYGKFRIPDLEYFYFLQYCIEDPECMGMIEITKRRFGKTYRAGLFLYEYTTRTRNANAGIQSKTGADAKKLFGKAVIAPFKKLPRFFRPEYDMSLGVTPKTEIRFQQTNVRGKKAEETLDKEELGSIIDHQSADVVAYDGQKLHRYVGDETGKTVECNVYDRHDVVRYCLLDDEGKIIGKALYTTTVEKMESDKDGVQEAFINLWNDSDQNSKGENGRTSSGLYRFFMTADRARNFDIYGYPNVEKTIREIIADRASVAHNLRALSNRIKKEARTIQEAFSTDGDKCIFNVINIDERDAQLQANPVFKRKVVFERNIEQKVIWRDIRESEKSFHWEITQLLPTEQSNKFKLEGRLKMPDRIEDGAITVDGYSNSQGGRKYGSKASAWIGRRFDIRDPDNTFKAIGHLYGRPNEKGMLHDQVMLAAEYYGYKVWYEHNADDYDSYFRERGKILYLGRYPLSTIDPTKKEDADRHRGFPTTPFSLTRQHDAGIAYFERYTHLIDYPELLYYAKKFDPYNRTAFDAVVSFLMLIVCLTEPIRKPEPKKIPLVRIYEMQGYPSDN